MSSIASFCAGALDLAVFVQRLWRDGNGELYENPAKQRASVIVLHENTGRAWLR